MKDNITQEFKELIYKDDINKDDYHIFSHSCIEPNYHCYYAYGLVNNDNYYYNIFSKPDYQFKYLTGFSNWDSLMQLMSIIEGLKKCRELGIDTVYIHHYINCDSFGTYYNINNNRHIDNRARRYGIELIYNHIGYGSMLSLAHLFELPPKVGEYY